MAALDGMATEHLADHLFTPERLTKTLEAYLNQSVEADVARWAKLGRAQATLTEIGG